MPRGVGIGAPPQMAILLRITQSMPATEVLGRAWHYMGGQNGRDGACGHRLSSEGDLLVGVYPFRPQKYIKSAISISFLPSSCSRSWIWLSYTLTVVSWENSSGPPSNECFEQERAHPLPLRGDPFPVDEIVFAKATRWGYLHEDANEYLVPLVLAGRQL